MKHKYGIVSVIGTTPDCIGDNVFGGSDTAKKLRSVVRDKLDQLMLDGYRVFVFGCGLGTAMWSHQAMNGIQKKFRRVLVMPKKGHVPEVSDKEKGILGYYDRMVKHADKVVCQSEPTYAIEHSDLVLAVLDPKKYSKFVKFLEATGKEIIIIDTNSVK